jgi:putative chitinase
MPINRDFFFEQCRWSLFAGRYRQSQVAGLSFLLDHWEERHAQKDDRWLAYILATSHHETDKKHAPIEEYGKGRGRSYGKPAGPFGRIYFGRGYCQLTWHHNYERFENRLGLPLLLQPELACDPEHAVVILFEGMLLGLYTGRKLADYIAGAKCDWVNARRVVNGLDKAQLIADHARRFYAALSYTTE